jgi:hypothetical protein
MVLIDQAEKLAWRDGYERAAGGGVVPEPTSPDQAQADGGRLRALRRWCDRLTVENACLRDLADLRDRALVTVGPAVCAACCCKQVAKMA